MGRSPCCEKAHTNKGAWTKEEDDRLIAYIRGHGEGCWRSLPKAAGLLRCGKSCRLRWSLIAGRLPGRTDNEIKNYWNTHIRRKLLSRGIDPATHRPIIKEEEDLDAITITTTNKAQEEEDDDDDHEEEERENHVHISSTGGLGPVMMREKCPDLNLELRISPPSEYSHEAMMRETTSATTTTLCFACSLGIQNSKDCSCSTPHHHNIGTRTTTYDFLPFKSARVFDYRTNLEMK
ncbi:hypothetical protein C2S51_008365 [Perilla frutescens var. frutescens]|nr:hypothetical protein C2S51_008365 [Perilla frutescens var. frutescens]